MFTKLYYGLKGLFYLSPFGYVFTHKEYTLAWVLILAHQKGIAIREENEQNINDENNI